MSGANTMCLSDRLGLVEKVKVPGISNKGRIGFNISIPCFLIKTYLRYRNETPVCMGAEDARH